MRRSSDNARSLEECDCGFSTSARQREGCAVAATETRVGEAAKPSQAYERLLELLKPGSGRAVVATQSLI